MPTSADAVAACAAVCAVEAAEAEAVAAEVAVAVRAPGSVSSLSLNAVSGCRGSAAVALAVSCWAGCGVPRGWWPLAICSARADGRADAPLAVSAGKLGCRGCGGESPGGRLRDDVHAQIRPHRGRRRSSYPLVRRCGRWRLMRRRARGVLECVVQSPGRSYRFWY